jgi:hypothetical protein
MKTLEDILKKRSASTEELLKIYDSLPPVTTEFMMGRWKGFEITTGHSMDGLLVPSGWYGKIFLNKEEVHPLVFFGNGKKELYAVNPKNIPLNMTFPKSSILGTFMKLVRPFIQTKKSKARLRMVEHRGKITATMLYDDKAIYDHFAKIDDNTVLGCMDLKGLEEPYFWVMERDDLSSYQLCF